MRNILSLLLAFTLGLALVSCASRKGTKSNTASEPSKTAKPADMAKEDPAPPEPTNASPSVAAGPGRSRGGPSSTNDAPRPDPIRPYPRVITKDAKTEKG